QKALARVPGTVIESELDKEKGKVVYEFEIRDKDNKTFDVLIDAKTGEIVGVEAEDEEDDDEDTKDNSQANQDKNRKWYAV
ncbi:MAG: PepSY domain-containing protein, partial [Pyrinomonadaceae bacterium]|nr:PepSY domain-containing protein [Pyrinomonadaceae bacterium]